MRGVLVVNPKATATTVGIAERVASVISTAVDDLEINLTRRPRHATELAHTAREDGADVILVFGGDGTTNEVLQALARGSIPFGVIPGGGANVFARSLRLPNDALAAAKVIADRIANRDSHAITLGQVDGRWFGCNAGFGFDAAVVRHVEHHQRLKRSMGQLAFVWSSIRQWGARQRRRHPAQVDVELPDGRIIGPVAMSLVANSVPYTYLGRRALRAHPQASFDSGLDLLTVNATSTVRLLRIVQRALVDATHVEFEEVTYVRDLATFTLRSPQPLPLMVDGDYVGERRHVTFTATPRALRVFTGDVSEERAKRRRLRVS